MLIKERITQHEKQRYKLYEKKYELEKILNKINEKIIFHTAAICNLEIKNSKKEQDRKR